MREDKKKLGTYIFRITVSISFAVFFTLFISNKYGYYDYRMNKKVTLTTEQIAKFEQDIRDGKEIDLEEYLINISRNNQNRISRTGLNISNFISNIIKSGVEGIFDSLGRLINENRDWLIFF